MDAHFIVVFFSGETKMKSMDIGEVGEGTAQGWAMLFQTCTYYVFCSVLFYAVATDVHFDAVDKDEPNLNDMNYKV